MANTIALNGENVDVAELEKRKSLISHLENYEKHPVVRGVIERETTFRKEIENFYNLCAKGEEIDKRYKKPSELIRILNEFGDKELDIGKLDYTSVREDYKRLNNPLRTAIKFSGTLLGFLVGVGGISTCAIAAMYGNPEVAVPAGILGVGGISLFFWNMSNPHPKGSNKEYDEYRSLLSNAGQVDHFILEHYTDHIIKKYLDK